MELADAFGQLIFLCPQGKELNNMIPFFNGLMVGGFVGVSCMCKDNPWRKNIKSVQPWSIPQGVPQAFGGSHPRNMRGGRKASCGSIR